jgi:hypothetical protein
MPEGMNGQTRAGRALIICGAGLILYVLVFAAITFPGGDLLSRRGEAFLIYLLSVFVYGLTAILVGAFLKAGYGWSRYAAVLMAIIAISTMSLLGLLVGVYVIWFVIAGWRVGSNNSLQGRRP